MSELRLIASGKVRDLYELDDEQVLLVASDRLSAFDVILPTPIPDKGRVLTALSLWWFEQLADLVPNHVVSTDVPAEFAGRAVVCRRLDMIGVECVARGYLTGSGLVQYRRTGAIADVPLPADLEDGSRLPEPVFTPTSKAAGGQHDEPMTYPEVARQVGADLAGRLRELTLAIWHRAAQIAEPRGLLVADTKVEFGRDRTDGRLLLGDELLTPDSSRFWPAAGWQPGRAQDSYDKQYVRDWLIHRGLAGTAAVLPPDVVERTRERYLEAYRRLTGRDLPG